MAKLIDDGDMWEVEKQPEQSDYDTIAIVEEVAIQSNVPYDEFWEDLLDQAAPGTEVIRTGRNELLTIPDRLAAEIKRDKEADRIKEAALEHVITEELTKDASKGAGIRFARKAWHHLKWLGTPAAIGAVLGYFGGGAEGATQGAIADSLCYLPILGLEMISKGALKDNNAASGLEHKRYKFSEVKTRLRSVESPAYTLLPLAGGLILLPGLYAATGAILSQGAGFCAKIGLVHSLVYAVGAINDGKRYQKKVQKEIQQNPVRYVPNYVPPTEE